jgi:hypothetical protein
MYMWLAITLLAAFGVFAPYIFDMDGFNGGYALAFLSLVLAITGLFVTIMYRGRARMLDAIVSGQNLLAHWTYSTEEWQSYTEKADKMERADKWALFRLVAIISIVVGIGFWLFHRESGFFAVFFIVGLLALLAVVVLITTRSTWRVRGLWLTGKCTCGRAGALLSKVLGIGKKTAYWRLPIQRLAGQTATIIHCALPCRRARSKRPGW